MSMSKKSRKKFPKLKAFIDKALLEEETTTPSKLKEEYEKLYPEAPIKTLSAYQKAFKRKGLGLEARKEIVKHKQEHDSRDILQYAEVQSFISQSEVSGIKRTTLDKQLKNIREVWELMNKTNPYSDKSRWNYDSLLKAIKEKVPIEIDVNGKMQFSNKGKVQGWLSAVNTMFPSILAKGWSNAFNIQNQELKDFLTFPEFQAYCENLVDTPSMSAEGWRALFKVQVSGALREGTNGNTGVLGLKWENINYASRRCKVSEKGGKGKAGRVWFNVPLDLYPFTESWNDLMTYHNQRFGYVPTNERHESGKVFPVVYAEYSKVFHETRKRTNGRIAGDKESFRPHIFRKTHANWNRKLKIRLEHTCGSFPNGYFGVGWDNPSILLKYYMVQDEEEIQEAQTELTNQIHKLARTGGLR